MCLHWGNICCNFIFNFDPFVTVENLGRLQKNSTYQSIYVYIAFKFALSNLVQIGQSQYPNFEQGRLTNPG
jgi:hypothetical protein